METIDKNKKNDKMESQKYSINPKVASKRGRIKQTDNTSRKQIEK